MCDWSNQPQPASGGLIMRPELRHLVVAIAVTALSLGCAGAPSTSPTSLEAVPLRGGAYSAMFSAFTRLPGQPPTTCPSIPADLTMEFPVTFEPSGLTWIGRFQGSSGLETGRIVLEPRSPVDAPALSGSLSGSAFTESIGPDQRMVAFGNEGVRLTGTVSASGSQVSGTLAGVITVFWSTSFLQPNGCLALQATLTLTRVQ